MKQTIKSILAFAALLLCGGAWAVVPKADAVFTTFSDGATVKGSMSGVTYTLSLGSGNSVNADGQIEIGTGSQVGARITADRALGTRMTVLVKYAAMPISNSAVISIFEDNDAGNGKQYVGARWRDASTRKLNGFYEASTSNNYNFSSGGGGADNAPPQPSVESGYLMLSYDLTAGTACFAGTSLANLTGGYVTSLKFGSRQNYGFAVGGPYTDTFFPACAGMKIEKIAVFLGQYHTGTSVTSYDGFGWRAAGSEDSDAITISNINKGSSRGVSNFQNDTYTICVPASDSVPAGSVVRVTKITLGMNSTNDSGDMPMYLKIGDTLSAIVNGTGTQNTSDKFATNSLKQEYSFADKNLDLTVGTEYTLLMCSDECGTIKNPTRWHVEQTTDAAFSVIKQSTSSTTYRIDQELVGVVQSLPTLPDTVSYTTGDPSDWQSTGVSVAKSDEISALKEIANRYSFAATFGNTSMDASPRDGTPLNLTLHGDGVLTVEMQVTNGGFKKAALIGFTVDGGLLKVKRIKSAYANTSFNGAMMTYTGGGAVTKASGVNDGSYILANVTLTRTTKFKDDAVEPDFLATTAPIIRYDASQYDNFTYNENGEVLSWKDLSTSGNNATLPDGNTSKGRVEIVNGVPAYEMGAPGSGIDLAFTTRATTIRTVFWVMDIKTVENKAFFLGDVGNNCYDFHRGESGEYYASQYASANVRNGTTYCDGSVVANPTGTTPPTGLHVYALKTTGNVSANRLSQDRTQQRNGGRAISELVVFNTALTDEQIAAMNNYLLYKWMGIESGEVSATLPDGSQNFSEIAWNDGGVFANGKDVTLAVASETTLTIDEEVLIGSLTLTGAGTLTINNAQNLSFGSANISGFTGTINYNVDATRAAFTADEGLKALMKSGTDNMTFTFTGSGSNGATVDYGSTQDTTTDVIFSCHIVFNGGTHTLKYVHEKAGSKFGANATAENPTILVTNNATFNFTGKNWCGWDSGAVNANGIIRVNSGSTLNANTDSVGTFYWAQQFYLEPGSTSNFRSDNQNVRFNGGISESAPQIYVPSCAADKENKVATVNLANNSDLEIRGQGTGGSAFYVGANATLKIGGNLTGNQNFTKYGDGILQITGNVTNSGTKTIAAGLYDIGAMRDFTTPGWTVSGTGGFLIHETSAEYAKADLMVTNPNNYTIKVVRPNGPTVYDLATVVDDTTIKISGAATSFDVTFNTKDTGTLNGHIDYQCLDYVRLQYDSTPTYINETTTPGSKTMGVYLKHHPYVHYLENNNDAWFKSTDEITLAVVGQMPSTQNTVFLHMGRSGTKNGLFLATGEADEEVKICYNKLWDVVVIDTLKVPNASSARHTYVITKHDDPEGTQNRQTTFEIWLDGELINTKKFDHFVVTGGIQVGKPYGDSFSGWNNVGDSDSTSYINLIRVYDRVISEAEILKYSDAAEYPYNSPQGTYQRNFTTDAGQMWKGADNAWTSSLEGEESGVALPLKGLVTANFAGATTITVNQTEATSYEKLILNGASDGDSTISFEKGEGAVVQISTLNTTINTPVVIKEGTLDLSGGPTKISAHGHVTFDYSGLTAQGVLTDYEGHASFKVTGLTQATADQFTLIKPTDARLDVSLVKHNDNNSYYVEATVKPVYLNNDNTFKLADGTAVATLLDGDKVIVSSVGYDGNQRWQVNLDNAALTGHTVVIDYPNGGTDPGVTIYSDIRDGVDIEILEGSKMYMTSNKSVWATSVSGDGTFSLENTLYLHKTLTVTCTVQTIYSGNFCLESDSILKVPAESSVKVTAYSGNQGYVKKATADDVDTYTFVAGTQEIAPSEDDEPVVVEDIGTGIIVNPGADVIVPTTADTNKIAVKYTIPGTETVKDLKADGLVTVAVNQETGALELTTTDSAKPATTAIAMATPTVETQDQVQFTITNPIPGLFYSVSSCDTPDGTFVTPQGIVGNQATSTADKTVSIPMTFTDGKKVKYYKVSVKATK